MLERRALLGASAMLAAMLPPPRGANAALPFTAASLPIPDGLRDRLELAARPKVRALPRRRMDLDFAVLLMRTGYQVADELDFVAMNQFQQEFFLFRQAEWERYREGLPRLQQGDLSDAAYFDFISFCQHATIAAEMRRGSQVVARPAELANNAVLPAAHAERVGDVLLQKIYEKYERLAPKVPPSTQQLSAELMCDGVRRLADIFEINDYMLSSRVERVPNGVEFALVVPATLWSQQVLALRGDLRNDYEVKVVFAWFRRCNVPVTCTTRFEQGTQVVHTFTWPVGYLA
ncbi:hypothetical protein AB1Y20_014947 [Prymnesium parvum]|uniref:Uncharacterized protein n=1 Tax=Prymnesium parvum TaxID=97485 RepID=A0AB34JYP2_PRYPA